MLVQTHVDIGQALNEGEALWTNFSNESAHKTKSGTLDVCLSSAATGQGLKHILRVWCQTRSGSQDSMEAKNSCAQNRNSVGAENSAPVKSYDVPMKKGESRWKLDRGIQR